MTKPIDAVGTSPFAAPEKGTTSAADANVKRVAKQFETMLVHQLLDASKVGGEQAQGGYGSMAVDALADGIQKGGGLGLARQIEDALNGHHGRH